MTDAWFQPNFLTFIHRLYFIVLVYGFVIVHLSSNLDEVRFITIVQISHNLNAMYNGLCEYHGICFSVSCLCDWSLWCPSFVSSNVDVGEYCSLPELTWNFQLNHSFFLQYRY
ncbi:unnamed protein product [Lathyrus sativus]|nr:unnamed protein product [Lathyrus sativus]